MGGVEKSLVPCLVPLGSALVQLTKTVFFRGKMLGSWLGSSWFRIGPTCENSVFYAQNAQFLAWFQLVPHWSNLRNQCFLQAKCLVPGLVPVGSALVPLAKTVSFTGKMLGSWLGSSWFRTGPTYENNAFYRQSAWFLAWFQLVSTWLQLARSTKSEVSLGRVRKKLETGLSPTPEMGIGT